MHLAQIRLRGIHRHARKMLHRRSGMRIALDAEAGNQANACLVRLAEGMLRIGADRDNGTGHTLISQAGIQERAQPVAPAGVAQLA